MVLLCRILFGLTVARQENNSDSDVIPESSQIQDLLMSLNNSPSNSPWERQNTLISFMNFVWHEEAPLPCQSRVARQNLSNLIA